MNKALLTLGDYLGTLWNPEKTLKRLRKPNGKFLYVHFIQNTKGRTFTYYTNNVQYINRDFSPHHITDEKKWDVWSVETYIKENNL
jgi:hypothetical protein